MAADSLEKDSRLKRAIADLAKEAGAVAAGVAAATQVCPQAHEQYLQFLAEGRHGAMRYMENHLEIRRNPALLLTAEDGAQPLAQAQSIVMFAFPYRPAEPSAAGSLFAIYARGADYHFVLRQRLEPVVALLQKSGFVARVCVDSAPLRERYWAVQAGLGYIGRNSLLIVPGYGTMVFLASIITDAPLQPDTPCTRSCPDGCRRCVRSCPGGAIGADGAFDARRCLSYLTIEYRGRLPEELTLQKAYGCDECQLCCPANLSQPVAPPLIEFSENRAISALTPDGIATLTRDRFADIFANSPVRRIRLDLLKRNALHVVKKQPTDGAAGACTDTGRRHRVCGGL